MDDVYESVNWKTINKNNLYISIHPKNGLLLGICKYFYNFTSLHIITGQIWANMKGLKNYMEEDLIIISEVQ